MHEVKQMTKNKQTNERAWKKKQNESEQMHQVCVKGLNKVQSALLIFAVVLFTLVCALCAFVFVVVVCWCCVCSSFVFFLLSLMLSLLFLCVHCSHCSSLARLVACCCQPRLKARYKQNGQVKGESAWRMRQTLKERKGDTQIRVNTSDRKAWETETRKVQSAKLSAESIESWIRVKDTWRWTGERIASHRIASRVCTLFPAPSLCLSSFLLCLVPCASCCCSLLLLLSSSYCSLCLSFFLVLLYVCLILLISAFAYLPSFACWQAQKLRLSPPVEGGITESNRGPLLP